MRRPLLVIGAGIVIALVSLTTAYTAGNRSRRVETITTGCVIGTSQALALPDTSASQRDTTKVVRDTLLPDAPMTTATPDDYIIQWHSINSGGGAAAGGSYKVDVSIGQPGIGAMAGDNYQAHMGFWYGAFAAPVVCACDCHADPQCNAAPDVLDVVQAVNVAFRNYPDVVDPNPMCPRATTDVDCDDDTDVIDVVTFVNVAFRNYDAGATFCDPCAP